MEQLLTFYAIVTGVNAAILWIAVKFIAPACEKNSKPISSTFRDWSSSMRRVFSQSWNTFLNMP